MTDLDHRLESAAGAMHRAISHVPADPASARPSRDQWHAERGPQRRLGLIAAATIAVTGVAGLVLIERRPDPGASNPPAAASTTATTTVAARTITPLELADAPAGLTLVAQGIRPTGGEELRAGVFVKRDAQGNVINRVIARLGTLSLYVGDQQIAPPPNLTTATSGDIYIDSGVLRVEYGLGDLGNLALDAYYVGQQIDTTLTDQMQQLAASLDLAAGNAIAVTGPLPSGWMLAAAGVEPEQAVPSFYQAFEVDSADGGPKIMIDNRMISDASYPYWTPGQTLQPVQIRGHAGFVTKQDYAAVTNNPDAPAVADPTSSATILIWEEAPGHWVTMWVADRTTEQAANLAATLVAVDQDQWRLPGAATSTTPIGLPVSSP